MTRALVIVTRRDLLDRVVGELRTLGGLRVDVADHPSRALALVDACADGVDVAACLASTLLEVVSFAERARLVAPNGFTAVLTHDDSLEFSVRCMLAGANEVFLEVLPIDQLRSELRRANLVSDATTGGTRGSAAPLGMSTGAELVGRSAAMREVHKRIGQVARSNASVLIRGESGTGKDLVARAIWRYGQRASRPFVAVNCAALVDSLLESELFGHERGAFTGATSTRIGCFEQATDGTLFLDEVGDLSLSAQAKLLRALQDQSIQRVGGSAPLRIDTRVIAATHQDLEAMHRSGRFREDLYYRLNVVTIHVPALRERKDDIPLLCEHFLAQEQVRSPRAPKMHMSLGALAALQKHDWPGNVRELENCVRRAAVLCAGDTVCVEHVQLLPIAAHKPEVRAEHTPGPSARGAGFSLDDLAVRYLSARPGTCLAECVALIEEALIRQALTQTAGNQVKAARLLGVSRPTLRKKLRGGDNLPGDRVRLDSEP
jgi:two-component system nitrogen regulation response regulator GlnG